MTVLVRSLLVIFCCWLYIIAIYSIGLCALYEHNWKVINNMIRLMHVIWVCGFLITQRLMYTRINNSKRSEKFFSILLLNVFRRDVYRYLKLAIYLPCITTTITIILPLYQMLLRWSIKIILIERLFPGAIGYTILSWNWYAYLVNYSLRKFDFNGNNVIAEKRGGNMCSAYTVLTLTSNAAYKCDDGYEGENSFSYN